MFSGEVKSWMKVNSLTKIRSITPVLQVQPCIAGDSPTPTPIIGFWKIIFGNGYPYHIYLECNNLVLILKNLFMEYIHGMEYTFNFGPSICENE